jgi:hypothetical protein
MKKKIAVLLAAILGMMAFLQIALGARSVDEQVKSLARRYTQVEDQLARSVRYVKKTESDGAPTVYQTWFNGAGDLIKVAVERTDASGRELTEYFAPDFENAFDGMFMLVRKETPLPDGGTQVEESRKYFGETNGNHGELLRELRKSARFRPDESLDTVHVPNITVDLSKKPAEKRNEVEQQPPEDDFFSEPQNIANALNGPGPPETDPFANITGDSEKYRVIHRTASPDGRYAIALGLSRQKIDWEHFKDPDNPGTYYAEVYADETDTDSSDVGKLVNYVVDLTKRHILGTTGCEFFGTRHRYNHRECGVIWSPDAKNFVELTTWKWGYECCRAGKITTGPKLVSTVDLGKYAEKVADGFRKAHKLGKERGSIAIFVDEVTDDGLIALNVTGQESSGERKGDVDFSINEKIRIRETPSGLRLETVSVRSAPPE